MTNYPWTVGDLQQFLSSLDPSMECYLYAGTADHGEMVTQAIDQECFHLIQNTITQGHTQITENILCIGDLQQ